MKRVILLLLVLLVACAPASVPIEVPRPTVNMVIESASPTTSSTETDEPTFTPIPATFTLEPSLTPTINFKKIYNVSEPTSLQGIGNARILIDKWIPGSASVSSAYDIAVFNVFADGTRLPFDKTTSIDTSNPLVAIEIITVGSWAIDFGAGEATATATIKATTTKIATKIATRLPTKIPSLIIPTSTRVIILPTNTPIVVSVPTNPPSAGCCKHCNPAKSKPCGDSCISLSKTCHVGQGCACSP